jgi:hypothetical protein
VVALWLWRNAAVGPFHDPHFTASWKRRSFVISLYRTDVVTATVRALVDTASAAYPSEACDCFEVALRAGRRSREGC